MTDESSRTPADDHTLPWRPLARIAAPWISMALFGAALAVWPVQMMAAFDTVIRALVSVVSDRAGSATRPDFADWEAAVRLIGLTLAAPVPIFALGMLRYSEPD